MGGACSPQPAAPVPSPFGASLGAIARERGRFADTFYRALLQRAPALRSLFRTDLEAQGRKLTEALAMLVAAHDRPAVLVPVLRALGARHHRYGARPFHYRVAAEALIEALAAVHGAGFTPELRAAWLGLFRRVACEMIAGGAEVAAAPVRTSRAAPARA